jgi:hypothetical protein
MHTSERAGLHFEVVGKWSISASVDTFKSPVSVASIKTEQHATAIQCDEFTKGVFPHQGRSSVISPAVLIPARDLMKFNAISNWPVSDAFLQGVVAVFDPAAPPPDDDFQRVSRREQCIDETLPVSSPCFEKANNGDQVSGLLDIFDTFDDATIAQVRWQSADDLQTLRIEMGGGHDRRNDMPKAEGQSIVQIGVIGLIVRLGAGLRQGSPQAGRYMPERADQNVPMVFSNEPAMGGAVANGKVSGDDLTAFGAGAQEMPGKTRLLQVMLGDEIENPPAEWGDRIHDDLLEGYIIVATFLV